MSWWCSITCLCDANMSRKVEWQRCFKVPKNRLDLFLVKVNIFGSTQLSYFEADYIFANGDEYDVVVSEYNGSYPYVQNEIVKFAEALRAKKKPTLFQHILKTFDLR